jgi:signal transduction histidine kinase
VASVRAAHRLILQSEVSYAFVLLGAALAVSFALRELIFPVPSTPFFVVIALVARRASLRTTLMVICVSTLALDLLIQAPFLSLDDPAEDVMVGTGMLLIALIVKRLDDDLRAAERSRLRLQDSSTLAVAAEERVRREIAELLHSRVQSRLVAAWSQLNGVDRLLEVDPAGARLLIRSVSDDLEDIREKEIRQASYLLHPSFIREGLAPAVDSLVERYEREFHISVNVSAGLADLDTPVRNRIPESLRLTAFRIVEEALGNVLRHARARSVLITLDLEGATSLRVCVADDGCGFDVAATKTGLGMASIESRVSQAGGTWSVVSCPGAGTTLSVSIPLPRS